MHSLFDSLGAAARERAEAGIVSCNGANPTMSILEPIRSELLSNPNVRHGFFTRRGGVSHSIYASLNCAFGSDDQTSQVKENRTRVADTLGIEEGSLVSVRQAHTKAVLSISGPLSGETPVADGMVTRTRQVGLAVLGADCAPVLLADPVARVVGAAHAGWKGALDGILEGTIDAMTSLGARVSELKVSIGPAIQQTSYEVGAEFREKFLATSADYAVFFVDGAATKFHFDLPRFIEHRLLSAGVTSVERSRFDTCADAGKFFSYRRATKRGEPDYGRQISAIVLV